MTYYLPSARRGFFFPGQGNQLWQLVFSADGVRDGYTPENVR